MNYFDLVKKLSDENYETREKSTKDLIKAYPLSRPAILIGCQSADPEIRNRCIIIDAKGATKLFGKQGKIFLGIEKRLKHKNRIDWLWKVQPDFVRWSMVDYALKDDSNKRMEALYLILCPFEDISGMPWFRTGLHQHYSKDKELIVALCDLVDDTWKWSDGSKVILACDPAHNQKGSDGMLLGLDNVRFWMRSLPDPSNLTINGERWNNIQKQWKEIKDEKYQEFELNFSCNF